LLPIVQPALDAVIGGSSGGGNGAAQPAIDVKSLHAKIGELTLENDFLGKALSKAALLSAKR
jgi:transposase